MSSNLMGSSLSVYMNINLKYVTKKSPRVFMNGDKPIFEFKTRTENRAPSVLLGDNTVIPKRKSC